MSDAPDTCTEAELAFDDLCPPGPDRPEDRWDRLRDHLKTEEAACEMIAWSRHKHEGEDAVQKARDELLRDSLVPAREAAEWLRRIDPTLPKVPAVDSQLTVMKQFQVLLWWAEDAKQSTPSTSGDSHNNEPGKGMNWQGAQQWAEAHVKAHNGQFPSVKQLAEIVGCSRPTMDKAISNSPLLARKADDLMISSNSLFIGIDPDLHHTAIAIADAEGRIVKVDCLKVPSTLKQTEAVKTTALVLPRILPLLICGETPTKARDLLLHFFVEDQELVYASKGKKKANPRDLHLLGQVSGVALAAAWACVPASITVELLKPFQWKGNVSKKIHHARICKQLGWDYEIRGGKEPYAVPINHGLGVSFSAGTWKHAMDAVGLALKGREMVLAQARKDKALAAARKRKETDDRPSYSP